MDNCPVCQNNCSHDGFSVAEDEVIPFFKVELLHLRYPDHPFPRRFQGLLASCFAFSQVLAHVRGKNIAAVYHTDNKFFHKFKARLEEKFEIKIKSVAEAPKGCLEACEFNLQK